MAVVEEKERKPWALRMSREQHAAIKQRADAKGMSMGAYMIAASLGELDVEPAVVNQRFAEIESRLDTLERLSELGGFG